MSEDSMTRRGRILNEKEVLEKIRVSRTTLHRLVRAGNFPRPTFVSENRKTWRENDVDTWWETVDARKSRRRRGGGRRPKPHNAPRAGKDRKEKGDPNDQSEDE